jgi:hypothetical protein
LTGIINVLDSTGAILGVVASTLNSFGQYGVSPDSSDPLSLTFIPSNDGSTFEIPVNAAYPQFGATVGWASNSSDLSVNSDNYVALAAVTSGIV